MSTSMPTLAKYRNMAARSGECASAYSMGNSLNLTSRPHAAPRIELGKDWTEILADYTEAELAVLVRHMRRTTELSRAQARRLRG
jgi:hypothetical protein